MDLTQLFCINAGAIAGLMVIGWVIGFARKNVNDIDTVWGLGFVMIAWVSLLSVRSDSFRSLLLAAIVSIWGVRLASYLAWRNFGKEEDRRYAAMRNRNKSWFPYASLITVYGLQGAIMWVVSLPIQSAMVSQTTSLVLVSMGLVIWAVGVFFEAVGDYQMARFKSNPANQGEVMDRGLWRYTRHPNYFGDCLVWWGIYLVALTPDHWWWTLISPVLMTVLLLRVSGVSLLEKSLTERVGPYKDYVRRTSSFIPMPPSQ